MSDLDEPLGEGSAVRHNGRRGTAVMEPDRGNDIKIRWEDDGTESPWKRYGNDPYAIKVSDLDEPLGQGLGAAKVCVLLAAGTDPDAAKEYRGTALSCAARKGHEEAVGALAEGGADPDKANRDGATPLLSLIHI